MAANGDTSDEKKKSNGIDVGIQLITEELFHDILEKQFGKCTIKKFTVTPSSSAGENYACLMYRVTIEAEKEGMTWRCIQNYDSYPPYCLQYQI